MRRTTQLLQLVMPQRTFGPAATLVAALGAAAGCTSYTDSTPAIAASLESVTPVNLTGTVGAEVSPAPTVRLKDQNGNPIRGAQVSFYVTTGGGTLRTSTVRTDANGTATVAWTLGTKTGVNVVAARSSAAFNVVFTATAKAASAAHVGPGAWWGGGEGAASLGIAGTNLVEPLSVRVTDRFGNPVMGTAVTFAVISGGGTIKDGLATTDSLGLAAAGPWTLGAPGQNLARASVPGLNSMSFARTALGPGGLAGISYELDGVAVGSSPPSLPFQLRGRIVFGDNGEFTSVVDFTPQGKDRVILEGHGVYGSSSSAILLRYSGDFLDSLWRSLAYWPAFGFVDSDRGEIKGDVIRLFRCWSEDCYDAVWTYRRAAP